MYYDTFCVPISPDPSGRAMKGLVEKALTPTSLDPYGHVMKDLMKKPSPPLVWTFWPHNERFGEKPCPEVSSMPSGRDCV